MSATCAAIVLVFLAEIILFPPPVIGSLRRLYSARLPLALRPKQRSETQIIAVRDRLNETRATHLSSTEWSAPFHS